MIDTRHASGTSSLHELELRPFVRRAVSEQDAGGVQHERTWGIAVESPVQIAVNGNPWTVMLATPADVEELALGIALTERVLTDATAVEEITVSEYLGDVLVNLTVAEDAVDASAQRARSLVSSTSCGVCGLESLAQLHARRDDARKASTEAIRDAAVLAAFDALPNHQPVNAATHSVHAAAWCAPDGAVLLTREDVGRHNALDKLVGGMARRGMLQQPGFIVMTSRCSYELVYKASVANTQLLATISAPTTMALTWARALDIPLACFAKGKHIVRFPLEEQDGR